MSAIRTDLRDKMIALASALPAFAGKVVPYKLDKVESVPFGSVYLEPGASEPAAMRGHRERAQDVKVSLFIDQPDAEAHLGTLLHTLEVSVESARRAGEFPAITGVHLSAWNIAHDPASKGRIADLHATFSFQFSESLI